MFQHRAAPGTRRTAVVGGGIAAVLLPLALAGPAVARTPAPAAAASFSAPTASSPASGQSTVSIVDEFYDGYITSLAEGDTNRAEKLRQDTIRDDYLRRLERWEEQNGTDGVLRSQSLPTGADVAYDGSGTGHSWAVVTLHRDGRNAAGTRLHVQTDLATGEISGIKSLD